MKRKTKPKFDPREKLMYSVLCRKCGHRSRRKKMSFAEIVLRIGIIGCEKCGTERPTLAQPKAPKRKRVKRG